jgi:hypothetical protein
LTSDDPAFRIVFRIHCTGVECIALCLHARICTLAMYMNPELAIVAIATAAASYLPVLARQLPLPRVIPAPRNGFSPVTASASAAHSAAAA